MPRTRIPSPARSQGAPVTPRREPRGSRSVGSLPRSVTSGRLSSLVDQFKENNRDSFALSPLSKTVLDDNTEIEHPRRPSWWKRVDDSRDILEVLGNDKPAATNNVIDEFDVEVLSQEKKEYTMDLPESSDSESISSIIVPQRKLFTQKENQAQNKYGQVIGTRESLAKQNKTIHDKTANVGPKNLFNQGSKRSKPIFPSALLNLSPDKTLTNKTKEMATEIKAPTRNLFGNRPAMKRKNMFADFIVSESEDDISDIHAKPFAFTKHPEPIRLASRGNRDSSPTSSITTDIEMDEWKHLPSSTMVEHQLEAMIGVTPGKRARLSKLTETKESSNSSDNKTKLSNKSMSKNKSKASPNLTRDKNMSKNKCNGMDVEKQIQIFPLKNDFAVGLQSKSTQNNQITEKYDEIAIEGVPEQDEEDENITLTYEDNEQEEGKPENNYDLNITAKNYPTNISLKLYKNGEVVEEDGEKAVDEHKKEIEAEAEISNDQEASHSNHDTEIDNVENEVSVKVEEETEHKENEEEVDENEHESEREAFGENEVESKREEESEDEIEMDREEDMSQNIDEVEMEEVEENEDYTQQNESHEQEEQDDEDERQEEIRNESQEEQEQTENESKDIDEHSQDNDADIQDGSEEEQDKEEEITNESDHVENQVNQNETLEQDGEENRSEPQHTSETPNVSHDTTGRHRHKHVESPEAISHNISNPMNSFTGGRNTSIRKTKSVLKNFTIRQSMAPPRESSGFSDGTKNSSAEGSGWDSHRTTRKTIRQTFGKDFTPRKSLRALVMEKSAKRQTAINEANAELKLQEANAELNLHQANSTELPSTDTTPDFVDDLEADYENVEPVEPSDHEISKRTRQTTLEMYMQKIKKDNMERRNKIEEQVRNSLKSNPIRVDFFLNSVTSKPMRRPMKPLQNAAKKRSKPSVISLEDLPPELVEDLKYKPPKRYRPSNASWITNRLYKFLESKLEPKYDYKARVRAETLVETIYKFARDARRVRVASPHAVTELKREMARLDVVKTHFDFYNFFHDYMPLEVKIKVVPDIVNEIPMPRDGVFADIIQQNQ